MTTRLDVPVVLIVFNRAETTRQVVERIAQARPRVLFIVADGPRADHPEDVERCEAARKAAEAVDWPCELVTHYAETNLGVGVRPATGISWVFEQVDGAIILEDDCVPRPSFFAFCAELLDRYRDDERVMHIAGSNFVPEAAPTPDSYFFSCHNPCWGWATWRRAWRHFDPAVAHWPALRDSSWLADLLGDEHAAAHWRRYFDEAHARAGAAPFWDYQWTFACWAQHGLSIVPAVNLVTNVGFGPDSTHFKSGRSPVAFLPSADIAFPLRHPACVVRNYEADRALIRHLVLPTLGPRHPAGRLRRAVAGRLPDPVRRRLAALRDSVAGALAARPGQSLRGGTAP